MARGFLALLVLAGSTLSPLDAQSVAPEGTASQRVAFVTSGTFGTDGASAAFYDNHSNYAVWTGTRSDGQRVTKICGDWDSNSAQNEGDYGTASFADSTWTLRPSDDIPCRFTNPRLDCFSNFPAVVFVDDFESKSSAAWDAPVPPI